MAVGKFRFAIALCWALGLDACVGPDFHIPEPPDIASYTPDRQPSKFTAQGATQHLDISRELPAEWWELFHSPALNGLINRALHDNPNIESARAALRVAQANMYAEVGQLFPLATGNVTSQGGKVATSPGGRMAASQPLLSGREAAIPLTTSFTRHSSRSHIRPTFGAG